MKAVELADWTALVVIGLGVLYAAALFGIGWLASNLLGFNAVSVLLAVLAFDVGANQYRFIRYRQKQAADTGAIQRANVELWESQQRVNRAIARDLQALRDSTRAAELAPQGMLRNGTTRVN